MNKTQLTIEFDIEFYDIFIEFDEILNSRSPILVKSCQIVVTKMAYAAIDTVGLALILPKSKVKIN